MSCMGHRHEASGSFRRTAARYRRQQQTRGRVTIRQFTLKQNTHDILIDRHKHAQKCCLIKACMNEHLQNTLEQLQLMCTGTCFKKQSLKYQCIILRSLDMATLVKLGERFHCPVDVNQLNNKIAQHIITVSNQAIITVQCLLFCCHFVIKRSKSRLLTYDMSFSVNISGVKLSFKQLWHASAMLFERLIWQ